MTLTRILLWTMIVSLAAAALLGILTIILPTAWRTQHQVLVTCLLIGAYTIPAFGCAAVIRKNRLEVLMWASIAALVISAVIWLVMLWISLDWHVQELMARSGSIATILGLWGSHFGVLWLMRLSTPHAVLVRLATLACAGLLASMVITAIVVEIGPDWYFKVCVVLGILAACGTLVTPMLALIDVIKARTGHETVPARVSVQLLCPRCGSSQAIGTGAGKCQACNLRIEIHIEEPRCTCGYQLYQLQGETCPECGRAIPQGDRWAVMQSIAVEESLSASADDASPSTR